MEVVLAEWLFESIQDFHVLTLDKRYFNIEGSVERWLYLYARKATGGANGLWKESFKSLYKKSASQQAYKHYASTLRKLIEKDELPGLRLELRHSVNGHDQLLMSRTEKPKVVTADEPKEQMVLIEKTSDEENWETLLEILSRRMGEGVVEAWIKPLHFRAYADGILDPSSTPSKIKPLTDNDIAIPKNVLALHLCLTCD